MMADVMQVRLDGGEELLAALRQMNMNVKGELRAAAMMGAAVVQEVANAKAPGPHIETEVTKTTASGVEVSIGPDREHWYYRFKETGAAAHEITGQALLAFEGQSGIVLTPRVSHPGMGASPFLRPAIDEKGDDAADAAGAALRRAIEEAA